MKIALGPGVVACLLACSLAACGGGGGGNDAPQEVLLLEFGLTAGSTVAGSAGDLQYTVVIRFGPSDTDLLLAVVDTDADGMTFEADPLDPAFGQLAMLLTNGLDDPIQTRTRISLVTSFGATTDGEPSNLRSNALAGPDLVGATITRIGLRVDTVDISLDAGLITNSMQGAFVVFGFPESP